MLVGNFVGQCPIWLLGQAQQARDQVEVDSTTGKGV